MQDFDDDLIEEKKHKRPLFRRPLLGFLKASTLSLLAFANQMAIAVEAQQNRARSKTHVISGVYVPALHHLISYEGPLVPVKDSPEHHRARVSAWLLLEARDYLGAIEWGYPDDYWWQFLTRFALFFKKPPRISNPIRHESGVLLQWHLVFDEGDQAFGVALRDGVLLEEEWLADEKRRLTAFATEAGVSKAILIANRAGHPDHGRAIAKIPDDFIIAEDATNAANLAYTACTGKSVV